MRQKASFIVCVLLQCMEAAASSQCWQKATVSEAVVSPAVRSSRILRVPNVFTLAQCVGACCDLPGCDLAWLFQRHCYILSCQEKEDCRPRQRPGADSYLAFLQRHPPQTLVLQSLVRGIPYRSQWRSRSKPAGDVEALKDLALFGDAAPDFGNPDGLDSEYSEVDLGSEEKGGVSVAREKEEGLYPDWPTELDGGDGFNQSESEDVRSLEPTGSSKPQSSLSVREDVNQALLLGDRSPTSSPTSAYKEGTEENTSLVSLASSSDASASDGSSQQSQIRASLPTETPPLPAITNTMSSTTEPVTALLVTIGDPVVVTVPVNTVEFQASVDPKPQTESAYKYEWSLMSSSDGHKRAIEREHSKSIKLTGLSAGQYTVAVAVTGENSYGAGTVNVTVKEAAKSNQPPLAVVFPKEQVVSPPLNRAVINASLSEDDGGIVSFDWKQTSGPPVELGALSSDTPVLLLSDLLPGDYAFRVTVTDADGLSDSTTVSVKIVGPTDGTTRPDLRPTVTTDPVLGVTSSHGDAVPPAASSAEVPPSSPAMATHITGDGGVGVPTPGVQWLNQPPVAVAGPDRLLTLPVSSVTLNASRSTDDRGIVSYRWVTASGPPGSKMEGLDRMSATVTGLRVGRYTFRLTVADQEGLTDSDSLTVRVQEAKSLPPVAHASGSHTLTLPNNSLVLRGSVTDADPAQVHFSWVRDHQSPAAGDVLYGSENQAFLYLANLVEGTYLFQLRVTDAHGCSSTATATVEVCPAPGSREEVELELLVAVAQVSVAQRDTVLRQLAALLHVLDNDIHLRALQGHSLLSTVLRFSVQGPEGPVPGYKLASVLHAQLLREKTDYLLFRVLRVDTVVCLLHCSGHGQCDPITKECVCDPFWTENLIRRFLGDGESNCEWRVIYLILSCSMVMVLILTFTWTFVCCCKRRRRTKVRKKTKYTILDNMDEQERMELRPKYNIKHRSTEHNSSLMMSESELDSDQDTIFSRDRPVRSRSRAHSQAARNGNAFG